MAQQPPAFQNQSKPARWRQTPPALYPPVLGLFGLAAGWSRAPDVSIAPAAIGQILTGAMVLMFLYVAGQYVAKAAKRPGVVGEDLKLLPGRAGLAALTMSAMLFAAALIPYTLLVAKVVLVIAIITHLAVLALVARNLLTGPVEARRVTPVMHLVFVGPIVSVSPALQFGWAGYATVVFWLTLAAALVIWVLSALQFTREIPPEPLRPLLAIHAAPASLLGMAAMLHGMPGLGLALGIVAIVLVAAIVGFGRWVTKTGFSPFWGAFTFPLAAFASMMMMLAGAGYGGVFRILGGVALVAASFFVPWVAAKVTQMWLKGALAVKTNAAVA